MEVSSAVPPLMPTSRVPASNGMGRASLCLGLAVVAVGVLQQIVGQMLPEIMQHFGLSSSRAGMIFMPFTIAEGLLALLASIFGLVSLNRPGLPRGAAAAGTALGCHALLSILILTCGIFIRTAWSIHIG